MAEFLLSFVVGCVIGMLIIVHMPFGKVDMYDTEIELCEKELPRNQKCVITARIQIEDK